MTTKLYWGAGIALVMWLLPPTISSGGGLAGSRHVDSLVYGTGSAQREDLSAIDARVLTELGKPS